MLMFFLCLIQLSLLYVGRFAVQHAAGRAARAAVVVLPDNPSQYEGEAVNTLDPDTTSDSDSVIDGFSALGVVLSAGGSDNGSPRLNAIRAAAYIPLIPISPSVRWLAGQNTVGRSFQAGAVRVASGLIYAQGATAVTFYRTPGAPASEMMWDGFGRRQQLTTRVTHLYNCSIPLAKDIMCHNLLRILLTQRDARRELLYTKNPSFPILFAVLGKRFVALRAESTLPIQGASYDYH